MVSGPCSQRYTARGHTSHSRSSKSSCRMQMTLARLSCAPLSGAQGQEYLVTFESSRKIAEDHAHFAMGALVGKITQDRRKTAVIRLRPADESRRCILSGIGDPRCRPRAAADWKKLQYYQSIHQTGCFLSCDRFSLIVKNIF